MRKYILTVMIGSLRMVVTGASLKDFKRKLALKGLKFSNLRYVTGAYDESFVLADGIHVLNETPSLSNSADTTRGTQVHIVSDHGYSSHYLAAGSIRRGLAESLEQELEIKSFETLGFVVTGGRPEIIIFVNGNSGYNNNEYTMIKAIFSSRIKDISDMTFRAYNFIV